MDLAVLIGSFFVLLFLGIPIAIALCASAMLYLALYTEIPLIIVGQQMLKGVDSFTLMAIPFFVIAGCLMQSGGISRRIVDFAKKLVGWMPGGLAVVDYDRRGRRHHRGGGRHHDPFHGGGGI